MSEELETVKHVVQKNETLVGIALKYDIKVDQLKKLNRLYANNTFEGQSLNVIVKKGFVPQSPAPTIDNVPSISISPNADMPMLQTPLLFSSSPIAPESPLLKSILTQSYSTPMVSTSSLSTSTPNKLKLSTSVPSRSFLDLINMPEPIEQEMVKPARKKSEVWDMCVIKPHEVVNCYAKYVPVHGQQITGVLTITPTRVIFEPNLDDPGVAKDGLLAHQFSVETGRLLEVEIFLNDVTFRDRLAKQLLDQAQWDVPPRKRADSKGDKSRKNNESKGKNPEKAKRKREKLKQLVRRSKGPDPIIHFDPTTEEMLQIVCSGRFRPKNYANFILPKEKGDVIYQRMVLFLSGSKEERLKAYLNLDVSSSTSTPPKPKLRRQNSFSSSNLAAGGSLAEALDDLKRKYSVDGTRRDSKWKLANPSPPSTPPTTHTTQISQTSQVIQSQSTSPPTSQSTSPPTTWQSAAKKDKQIIPKLKKERSKTEDKLGQDLEATKKKKAEAEQAKLLKEQQKKEKKALKEAQKEASSADRRRGSISEKWRAVRKTNNPNDPKSPTIPTSPILSTSPTSPLSSPLTSPSLTAAAEALPIDAIPALDITERPEDAQKTESAAWRKSAVPQHDAEEDAEFLPSMRDESLIFNSDDMHQLRRYLPGYSKWMDWKLLYSTQNHGISFSTFLYRTKNYSPTLFIMEDSNGFVFGGFATAPWAVNPGYFGTGQSFLFSLKPKLHVYEWTRANPYFMLTTPTAIAMGGDKEGRHGFWIDTNFEFGSSEVCSTFFNRCLAGTERFKCTIVEVWTLTDSKIKD